MANLGEYLGAGSGTTKLLLHLNGNSTDSSGNGNNGSDTNITYSQANGKFGQGAGFSSGSSSRILTGGLGLSTSLTAVTVMAWAKPSVLASGPTFLSAKIIYQLGLDTLVIGEGHTEEWVVFFRANDNNYYDALSDFGYVANEWRHICGTYDGSALKLYIDGELRATTNYSGTTNGQSSSAGEVGSAGNGTQRYFDGSIDEVIIENRAWSAEEVKKYYTYSKGRFNL